MELLKAAVILFSLVGFVSSSLTPELKASSIFLTSLRRESKSNHAPNPPVDEAPKAATPKPATPKPVIPNKAASVIGTFGSLDQIGDLVKAFDLSKDSPLQVNLAPSFGSLNAESVKTLEVPLKVSIAGTSLVISRLSKEKRTWENVLSSMLQNPLVKEMSDSEIRRSDQLTKESSTWFHVVSATKNTVIGEVFKWFKDVVSDEEVIDATSMNESFMTRLVSRAGTSMDDMWTIVPRESFQQENVVDVAVLRYPDEDNAFFKLYRIKLDTWVDNRVDVVHQQNRNGLTGEFLVHKFQPREDAISRMPKKTVDIATKLADEMFDA